MAYIISSGEVSSGIILNYDSMTVLDGGIATNTTVNERGSMWVSSGGTANSTTVNSRGYLYVSSGGTANSTTVNSGGRIIVSSGGTANSTSVSSGGSAIFYYNCTATGFTIFEGANAVFCIASNTAVSGTYAGFALECKNGIVSNWCITSGLSLLCDYGGTANNITVNSGGQMFVRLEGEANNTTVNSGGYVWLDGEANSIAVNPGGTMYVSSSAKATIIENGGRVLVAEDANVTFVPNVISGIVFSNTATLHSGTTANNTTVYSGLDISGGIANGTINSRYIEVFFGGTANNTTNGAAFAQNATMSIHFGGTANNTVNYGNMYIYSGGTANNTVGSGGGMYVSGGTVNNASFSNGRLDLFSGGVANSTTVNDCRLYVSSGGSANNTDLNSNGCMYVYSGGMASDVRINSVFASMAVFSGGTADNIQVKGRLSELRVSSGGTATNVDWDFNGYVFIDAGAYVTFTSNYSGIYYKSKNQQYSEKKLEITHMPSLYSREIKDAEVYVMSGGTASDITLSSFLGVMNVYSGGTVKNITMSGGGLYIFSGATATDIVWTPGQDRISIADGAYVTFAGSYSGVYYGSQRQLLSQATWMDSKIVCEGSMYVMSGGTANDTTLNRLSYMYVFSGGTANRTVNEDGDMYVSSSGTANSTTVNIYARMYVSSGGTANSTTINFGRLQVSSGGTANDTTLNGGNVGISSGGIANNTLINDRGDMYVSSGGIANCITLNAGGEMFISSGGAAKNTTVKSGGCMVVSSGGTATDIVAESGAWLHFVVAPDTCITGTSAGLAFNLSGGVINDIIVERSFFNEVWSGGIANSIVVNSGGSMHVSSGGAMNDTTFNGTELFVSSGGIVNNTTVNSGELYIRQGGIANNTILNSPEPIVEDHSIFYRTGAVEVCGLANSISINSGYIAVTSGGTANNIILNQLKCKSDWYVGILSVSDNSYVSNVDVGRNCRMVVWSGAIASNVVVHDNRECPVYEVAVYFGGIVYDTVVERYGHLSLEAGRFGAGTAFNTEIKANGYAEVQEGGIANNTIIDSNGTLYVYSGGTANCTIVNSKGFFYINGKTTGQMAFAEGAIVSAMEGAVFDFDISELAPEKAITRVNNLAVVKGLLTYTLTVSASQANGVYSLADRAASFDSTITVVNTSGDTLGVLAVGETVKIKDDDYTLIRNGENLILSINAEIMETTDPVDPDVIEPGKDVLLAHIMPEAEYMYGCTSTAVGMILGYYDLYGYGNAGFSNMIEGNVDLKSRGTDGNAYDMDAFDTVLGRAIASEEYVYRFHSRDGVETSPKQELEYAFMPDNKTLNMDLWNCLADYLGTGQYWRGNDNLSTDIVYGSLESLYAYNQFDITEADDSIVPLYDYKQKVTITSDSTSRTIRFIDQSMEHGLNLYVQSRGYKLDDSITGTYAVNDNGGFFTFIDYIREIDAGRPVLIHIEEHTMVGYGYNEDTQEIIFDDCYESGQRMVWGGTYHYAGEDRKLQAITVIALDESSGKERPDVPIPENLASTVEQVSWNATGANTYIVEYSMDNFEHVIQMVTTASAIDMPDLPAGNYQWRVKADANSEWAVGEAIVSEADSSTPKVVQAVEDGNDDLFFATTCGTWENIYYAQHVGSINDWTGTNEIISASGKGRIQNLFFGSSDPNVLCLTDGENGDAIFLDDVYTELPEELEANTARLLRIREIRAGAGDDIIDMTSQRFEYVGGGQTLCGGDGSDTIWANKGANWLFGDAGDDRITGASGDDVIAGGIGDDRMHGGGGDDVFTFCENWGTDTVKQLDTGTVTLWFASGSIDNWDEETLTYSDGTNSVKVSGVAAEQVTLKFGAGATPDDADQFASLSNMGAFEAFTTRKIFEEATLA